MLRGWLTTQVDLDAWVIFTNMSVTSLPGLFMDRPLPADSGQADIRIQDRYIWEGPRTFATKVKH